MTGFEQALAKTLDLEGPMSDVKGDPGGRTRYGIAEAKHPEMWKDGPPSLEAATAFYRREFWDALRLDEIASRSQKLAEKLFDIAVNCGQEHAGTFLQRGLNAFNRKGIDYPDIVVDGHPGDRTLSAFASYANRRGPAGIEVMHECLQDQQGVYYLYIGEHNQALEDFEFGWFLNRVML